MASVFGHAISSLAITSCFDLDKQDKVKVTLLAMGCAMVPDADVANWRLGFEYGHWLGHRGFTHSIIFALLFATLVRWIFFSKVPRGSKKGWILFSIFFLNTVSHGMLDAMTTGGKGIPFFSPIDHTRYFFPWRVIQVSPMSAAKFFGEWGVRVIKSEAFWIGIPSIVVIIINAWRKRKK